MAGQRAVANSSSSVDMKTKADIDRVSGLIIQIELVCDKLVDSERVEKCSKNEFILCVSKFGLKVA